MEPHESSGLGSYYHPQPPQGHHHQPPPHPTAANPSPTNGILPTNNSAAVFAGSVPSAVPAPLKRKRGRPRKYGTPEQAAAAKRLSSAASGSVAPSRKKDSAYPSSSACPYPSSKNTQLSALGHAGQSFTPHMIYVAAGEDVGQKIMSFMQQSKRELCILSASGSISNASLSQPATSGGNITYEGRFDVLSLSGSYVRTELGGRTGGLSICLASTDGQIIGGGVAGPLVAATPIQVIVGTFVIDSRNARSDASASKLTSTIGTSSVSGRNQFMVDPQAMHLAPSPLNEWRSSGGLGMDDPAENGNYDRLVD